MSTDRVFTEFLGGGSVNCSPFEGAPCTASGTFKITRAVGPGLNTAGIPPDFDNLGLLRNPDLFIAKGVIEPRAGLSVIVSNGDIVAHEVMFSVNGTPIGSLTVSPGALGSACLAVPISALRFALRSPVPPPYYVTVPPTPGVNEYTVTADGLPPPIGGEQGVTAGVQSITFYALAPIVLVHGIRSGYTVWDPLSLEFVKERRGVAAVQLGEGRIEDDLPTDLLIGQSKSIADSFGVRRVHLLTHSKGGLWSRAMIAGMAASTNTGVFSLTTMGTPHEGSVAADLADTIASGALTGGISIPVLTDYFYSDPQGPLSSIADLTVFRVRGFNSFNPPVLSTTTRVSPCPACPSVPIGTNTIEYRAIAGDTDLNSNGVLEINEAGVYGNLTIENIMYGLVANTREIVLRRNASGVWVFDHIAPQSPPVLNDSVVSTASAFFSSANHFSAEPLRKVHHVGYHSSLQARTLWQMFDIARERALERPVQE